MAVLKALRRITRTTNRTRTGLSCASKFDHRVLKAIFDLDDTQRYHGVVLPEFNRDGNLLSGIHQATMAEVKARFARNKRRMQLFEALEEVISILKECNCPEVYLDGSFITQKEEPGDYDLCYEPTGIKATDRFFMFLSEHKQNKGKYLGDIFPHMPEPPYHVNLIEFWQTDTRNNDSLKGIVKIDLRQEKDDAKK